MITVVEYDKERREYTVHENVEWREFQTNGNHLYWWDLNQTTVEESECLIGRFHFHPLAVEDCLMDVHLPKVDFYDDYLYMIVHGVDPGRTAVEGFAPRELDIFLGKNYLLTFHKTEARSISEVLRRCREKSPIFEFGLDFVLYSILDVQITNYGPVIESLEDELDRLEQLIFEKAEPEVLRQVFALKRSLLRLRKTINPQKEVINHLARNEYAFVQPRTQAYFRDVYDMLYRMTELNESFRDITTGLVETYLSTVSNRLNEIMKLLTLIATIFMPLTVITGVYGMNFENMPEIRWHYGYFYALGFMGVVVAGMVGYFKWRKWI